jgi:putative transposase
VKRFEFIFEHRNEHTIAMMARVLRVSRSGYQQWFERLGVLSDRGLRRLRRDELIFDTFQTSKQRPGVVRIQHDLEAQGHTCDVKTITCSMRRQGLVAKATRRFKVATDSDHSDPIAKNLLDRNFTATAPNQKWAGDITYLYTSEGWLYLSVIIDLYSRSVIGWPMAPHIKSSLVCDALKMAMFRRGFPKGVMVHSDRGSQYYFNGYRELLDDHQLKQSMSRKSNCWDNECVESFFHSLKVEAVHDEPLRSREEMRQAIFEYIEVNCNLTRRHSAIGYLSPTQFEQLNGA